MSFSFVDKHGRPWDLTLDLLIMRRIDASDFTAIWDKEFSILNLDESVIRKLLVDPNFLFAVIWVVVQPQVQTYAAFKDKSLEEQEAEFVSGINGAVINEARNTFMEALGDFFPDQRTVLSALTEQVKKLTVMAGQKTAAEIGPLLDQLLEQEFDQKVAKLRKELLNETPGETSSSSLPQSDIDNLTYGNLESLSNTSR